MGAARGENYGADGMAGLWLGVHLSVCASKTRGQQWIDSTAPLRQHARNLSV